MGERRELNPRMVDSQSTALIDPIWVPLQDRPQQKTEE